MYVTRADELTRLECRLVAIAARSNLDSGLGFYFYFLSNQKEENQEEHNRVISQTSAMTSVTIN